MAAVRTNHDQAIIAITGDLLADIREGRRVFSRADLLAYGKPHGYGRRKMEPIVDFWERDEAWLQAFVPPGGRRTSHRVTMHCPVIDDADLCSLETLLELAGPGAHFSYRSALALLGLSEEQSGRHMVISYLKPGVPPDEQRPFERSTTRPAAWGDWDGSSVWRVARSPNQTADFIHHTADGLPVSSAERCLLDCWLRPAYGVSDDRLVAAYRAWWSDHTTTAPQQKIRRLARVDRADGDPRPGRRCQYHRFLLAVDEELAALLSDELDRG